MSAFQFPDPLVESTVVNSATNTTYQWLEVPGKWVVVSSPLGTEELDGLNTSIKKNASDIATERSERIAADNTINQNVIASEGVMMERISKNTTDIQTAQNTADKAENDAQHAETSAARAQQAADNALDAVGNIDLSGYALTQYVDGQDKLISDRLVAVENDYTTSDEFTTQVQRITDNKQAIAANTSAIEALESPEGPDLSSYATKSDLSIATSALPYRLETDKTMRSSDLPVKTISGEEPVAYHAGGEIQLVDNLGYFHNVTFTGRYGVTTTSTASGIEVSAKDLRDRIDVLEEAVQTLASLIPPVDIGTATIGSNVDVDGGNAAAAQDELFIMWCDNDGETEYGLRYNWSITRGNGRISGSTTSKTISAWCSDPAPSTVEFQCVVSHPADGDATATATKLVLVAEGA